MKHLTFSIISIALIALIASCKPQAASTPNTASNTASATNASVDKIVYVDLDTLLEKSELYQAKKKDLESSQKVSEKDIASKIQAFQNRLQRFQQDIAEVQQKAQTIAPVELKKLEERFGQQEANLKKEEEALYSQRDNAAMGLQNKLLEAQKEVQKNIDDYLAKLAKEKGYDLILMKGSTGSVMYGDARLDITSTVIEQLNADYKAKSKK
jgi:outer membrane protein